MSLPETTPAPLFTSIDFAGKVAIVSGASAGIGRATVDALLANGVTCYGLSHDVASIRHKSFHSLQVDLRDPAAIDSTITVIQSKYGVTAVDYLVNVAGVDPKLSIEEGDDAAFDSVVDLNLRAYYLLIRRCLPLIQAGTGRAIVNVSSINYRLGLPGRAIYSASKAGILGLTTGLARQLGRDNIRINTVTPGWIFTERQVAEYFSGADSNKHLAHLATVQSLPIRIQSSDVANHILFYLSNISRASTGHNCVVDGGWLLE